MSRPKHPTSAYNLFFQYERYRLLENLITADLPKIDDGIDEDEDEYALRLCYTVITAADVDKAQKYSSESAKRKLERDRVLCCGYRARFGMNRCGAMENIG
jgi:hypothetical protein